MYSYVFITSIESGRPNVCRQLIATVDKECKFLASISVSFSHLCLPRPFEELSAPWLRSLSWAKYIVEMRACMFVIIRVHRHRLLEGYSIREKKEHRHPTLLWSRGSTFDQRAKRTPHKLPWQLQRFIHLHFPRAASAAVQSKVLVDRRTTDSSRGCWKGMERHSNYQTFVEIYWSDAKTLRYIEIRWNPKTSMKCGNMLQLTALWGRDLLGPRPHSIAARKDIPETCCQPARIGQSFGIPCWNMLKHVETYF